MKVYRDSPRYRNTSQGSIFQIAFNVSLQGKLTHQHRRKHDGKDIHELNCDLFLHEVERCSCVWCLHLHDTDRHGACGKIFQRFFRVFFPPGKNRSSRCGGFLEVERRGNSHDFSFPLLFRVLCFFSRFPSSRAKRAEMFQVQCQGQSNNAAPGWKFHN